MEAFSFNILYNRYIYVVCVQYDYGVMGLLMVKSLAMYIQMYISRMCNGTVIDTVPH